MLYSTIEYCCAVKYNFLLTIHRMNQGAKMNLAETLSTSALQLATVSSGFGVQNMLGVLANVGTVVAGSLLGMTFKKFIPESLSDILLKALGLCTLYIGISGAMGGKNILILIISMVLGTLIGALCNLDGLLCKAGDALERRFSSKNGKTSIAEGFVTSSLVFCVGAMTIVGSLNAGISGDNQMLYTKAMLDLVSSTVFASTLGVGVLFSALFVLVFQGGLVLLAGVVAPFLSEIVIAEMTCAGSIIIMGIGLNLIGITKLKTMNFLPAMFMPIIVCPVSDFIVNFLA